MTQRDRAFMIRKTDGRGEGVKGAYESSAD